MEQELWIPQTQEKKQNRDIFKIYIEFSPYCSSAINLDKVLVSAFYPSIFNTINSGVTCFILWTKLYTINRRKTSNINHLPFCLSFL